MRKKLLLILLSFSLVFLFLTMHQVYGEGWNNAQTKQWDYLVTQSSQIIDLLLVFTIVALFVVFGYAYWFRIRNPKKV